MRGKAKLNRLADTLNQISFTEPVNLIGSVKMIDKADWKYVNVDPDEDFDPKHNQRVIDKVIRQNEKNKRRIKREEGEKLAERSSAVASFVKHVDKTKSNISLEGYFGKRYFAKLRGQQIVDKLRNAKKKAQSKKA